MSNWLEVRYPYRDYVFSITENVHGEMNTSNTDILSATVTTATPGNSNNNGEEINNGHKISNLLG